MGQFTLHIGIPKSGTTYVQGILAQNRRTLGAHGWRYPGMRLNQQHAVYGICGDDVHFLPSVEQFVATGKSLQTKVRAVLDEPDGGILVSAEVLGTLSDAAVERFVAKVGTPERVVVTVRGLHSLLVSMWQQSLKTGHTETLPRSLERFEKSLAGGTVAWLGVRYGEVVRRWAEVAPVHAVVVPSRGGDKERLWHLFRMAADLPHLPDLSVSDGDANISLTHEAAALMRRMNATLKESGTPRAQADALRRNYLKEGVFPLAGGKDGGQRLALSDDQRDRVSVWNARERGLLEEHATTVHGDVADLEDRAGRGRGGALQADQVAGVAAKQMIQLLQSLREGSPSSGAVSDEELRA